MTFHARIQYLIPFFILTASLFLQSNNSKAQTWSPVDSGCYLGSFWAGYADSINDLLYVGGSFDSCGTNFLPSAGFADWNGTSWTDLTGGTHVFGGDWTYCITKYNGDIYHGELFGSVFNGAPQSAATRVVKMNSDVYCMAVFNHDLYIGGSFTNILIGGNVKTKYLGIAYWDGSKWNQLDEGLRAVSGNAIVKALYVWNNKLYVGGRFDSAGKIACHNLAAWDGSSWQSIDNGVTYSNNKSAMITALGGYNGSLVVGGKFDKAGSVSANNFVSYSGTSWNNMGLTLNNEADAFQTYNGDLYVGGQFKYGSNFSEVVRYNNNQWITMGKDQWHGDRVSALVDWRGSLYVLGRFSKVNGISVDNIAAWTIAPPPQEEQVRMKSCWVNLSEQKVYVSLNAALSDGRYLILNSLGQEEFSGNVTAISDGNTITADISKLTSGLYEIEVFDGKTTEVHSFVK